MRKLVTTDVFDALRLVQRSGLREKLKPLIKEIAEQGTSAIDAGIMGFFQVVEIFAREDMEYMIYEWLAGPFEKEPEEVAHMDLDELTACLEALGRENNLRAFFTALSGLISKQH